MKKFSFLLDERLVNDYFKPLRSKKDVLRLLMKSIKFMLVDNPVCEERKAGEVILLVSKMSRLFFISPEKKFSIGFPFGVIDNDNSLTFSSAYIPYVDSKVTSDVLSILANVACFEQEGALEFVDPIVEMEDQERNFWPFLLNLLMYEDGYIRYDYDEVRANGDQHPLNHFDIFYSSISTCKIGLRQEFDSERLIDLLSTETNCHYLEALR